MPLPADVLPQLLHGSSVSGQSEAQRGLWDLREGKERSYWCVSV